MSLNSRSGKRINDLHSILVNIKKQSHETKKSKTSAKRIRQDLSYSHIRNQLEKHNDPGD